MVPSAARRLLLPAVTLIATASVALAQGGAEPVVSGPAAGVPLPSCTVFAPSGPFAGQQFDAAARVGSRPGVLLFVPELTRNVAPMITGLDRLGVQLAWTGIETHTIRVAADRTEAELGSKRSSEALGLQRPIVVSVDGVDGPGAYALDRKAALTLVLAKDGKVVKSVAFTDTGRADLERLRGLVEEVTGPIPTDPAELRRAIEARLTQDPAELRQQVVALALLLQRVERVEQGRMQRQQPSRDGAAAERGGPPRPAADRPREGKPPEDEELRGLLRRAIQRAADAAELDAVFAAIDVRVGQDAALGTQAVEMFKLVLSLDYGNDDAKGRARAYLDKHGKR